MLISYPVLGDSKINESPFGGRYPLAVFKDSHHEGLTAGGHGGLHLQVNAATAQGPVVRAIADGIVVAYHLATRNLDVKEELEKHPLNDTGAWTGDGFVRPKHEKKRGEEGRGTFLEPRCELGGGHERRK